MNDSAHRGRSTDDLIMRVYPDVIPSDPEMSNYMRIVKAFKRIQSGNVDGLGPDISNKEIDKVCDLSGESKDKVVRILQDEDIHYTLMGRPPVTTFSDLSEDRQETLAWHYNNPDMSYRAIADNMGYESHSTVSSTITAKGWMTDDRFVEDELKNWFKKTPDTDEIIEKAVDQGIINKQDDDDEDEQQQDRESEHVELTLVLSGEDELFDYISGLVQIGELEKAKDVFSMIINQ